MLIQFSFKNFKSFRDEAVLDLSATKITEFSDRVVSIGREKLLPVAAIYGANASGKSNVYNAFEYMSDYVAESFKYGDEDENFELREKVKLKVPTRTGKGFVVEAGEGEVSLSAGGLTFVGVKDGKDFDLYIPMHESFYLLYGMGLGFQTFVSTKEYYAFCPDNAVKAMEWYYASEYFADRFTDAKK